MIDANGRPCLTPKVFHREDMRQMRRADDANFFLGGSKSFAKSVTLFKKIDLDGNAMHLIDIGQNTGVFRVVVFAGNRLEQPGRLPVDFGDADQFEVGAVEWRTHSLQILKAEIRPQHGSTQALAANAPDPIDLREA